MPLQERWILDNIARIEAHVFLPLGACLDFYTDTVYRGPRWMTDHGLEWLTRLVIEPQRLWDAIWLVIHYSSIVYLNSGLGRCKTKL
jgi:N-acetylglucosaminyldiphosphoundecaprenol N-acetyl-beta-D-mannosaminyltransferase